MRMSETIVLVGGTGALVAKFGGLHAEMPTSPEEVRAAFRHHNKGALWVASRKQTLFKALGEVHPVGAKRHRLLVLGETQAAEREFLHALFDQVIAKSEGVQLLPARMVAEVLSTPERANYFIGGTVAPASKALVLFRGNLAPVVLPSSWFKTRTGGPKPDFEDFEVIDCGQTVRLGEYEAASDAILYDLDPEFRSRAKARQLSADKSFGGALRRLRLQRRLSRDDFPDISAKTIARIERGEVTRPHGETLGILAERLGVNPEEIETF
jgi:hypothetical protein